jgi:hypothetical protein
MTEPTPTPPPLPTDPKSFYCAGPDLDALQPAPADAPSALERLGPSPFPKAKFPFLGFLASVYDHVSTHARTRGPAAGEAPPPPAE